MALKQISIHRELEKNPDITMEDVKKLRDWLKTQPHLPADYISDVDLLIAYHSCELSPEVTKQVIDLHYTLRTEFTCFFKNRQVDKALRSAADCALFYVFPECTPEGYRAIYLRLQDNDPRNFVLNDLVKTFLMVFELAQREEGAWPGLMVVIDMDGAVLGHIARLDLMTVKRILFFVQECLFIRLKEVHFLNAPSFMDKVLMLLRPFLSKHTLSIINVHAVGDEAIYKKLPKKYFPKEQGGELLDHKTIKETMLKRIQENQDYFKSEENCRVKESLRPGQKPAAANEFGIQGSFKKLDID